MKLTLECNIKNNDVQLHLFSSYSPYFFEAVDHFKSRNVSQITVNTMMIMPLKLSVYKEFPATVEVLAPPSAAAAAYREVKMNL